MKRFIDLWNSFNDNDEVGSVAKHFLSNLIPVSVLAGIFLVIYFLGSLIFWNLATTVLAVLIGTAALTALEYEPPSIINQHPSDEPLTFTAEVAPPE